MAKRPSLVERQRRRAARRRTLVWLALLALLVGAGAWNYQRNVALEQAQLRPYRTLSDADLGRLLAATEAEAAALTGAYDRARGGSGGADRSDDRFAAFARAHEQGRQSRDLGYRASELEAMAGDLRDEQALRAGRGSELQVFLRRVLVLSI